MMNLECPSPVLKEIERPVFELTKTLPPGIPVQIEAAVQDFIQSSHMSRGVDLAGFYESTLKSMANATVLGQGGDLWLGIAEGKLWTYILAQIGSDYDGKLSYTVLQAWVHPSQRGKPWVKWAWEKVRQRAKDCFCKHLAIISSRENDKVYCRFLGKGFHYYASILKEEI